jgi:hypothetical protein
MYVHDVELVVSTYHLKIQHVIAVVGLVLLI